MTTWHSEALDAIAPALAAAQGALGAVKKGETARMGTFSYHYATLADCVEAGRPVLAANGLSLTQFPGRNDAGRLSLLSILLHRSGQWLANDYPLAESEGDRMNVHQAEGSALTYARRYAYCAILGIATEDDDGAAASKPGEPRKAAAQPGDAGDALPKPPPGYAWITAKFPGIAGKTPCGHEWNVGATIYYGNKVAACEACGRSRIAALAELMDSEQ